MSSIQPALIPTANQECNPSLANPCARVDGQNYKALLVGICGTETASDEYPRLNGPHTDVESVRALLIDCYGYLAPDITILIDDGIADHVQPTRANILKAMGDLVKDAKAGDHICFHYCGHSMQIPNHRNSEEDGMDECLIPCDGADNRIVDNELNAALVLPLPAGCQLVAVLDTCHSGSLLDLKHYRCNRVVVPWKWPGKRGSDDMRRRVVRNNARFVSPATSISLGRKSVPSTQAPDMEPSPTRLLARGNEINMNLMCQPPPAFGPLDAHASSHAASGPGSGPKPQRTFTYRARTVSFAPDSKENDGAPLLEEESDPALPGKFWVLPEEEAHLRCESPVTMFACTGWCRDPDKAAVETEPSAGGVRADVISLASCKDSQSTYEDEDGNSMTSSLVEILRREPNQSLKNVLLLISHAMHTKAVIRHGKGKQYKREFKNYRAQAASAEKYNTQYHRTMSLIVSSSSPSPLPPAPTFPGPKLSFLARRIEELKKLKLLVFQSNIERSKTVDLDNFQNPELSSAKPLNLEWQVRL